MYFFESPFSGDANQSFKLFNWFTKMTSGQFGFINVNLGRSSSPAMEQEILENVGTYGRQLNKINAALRVLADELIPEAERKKLPEEKQKALERFERMMKEIDDLKESARKRRGFCPFWAGKN